MTHTRRPANLGAVVFPVATRFTTANAREMARRAVEARRLKRLAPPPIPQPVPPEQFAQDALNRVRAHLRKVDSMLQEEKDPLSVERLARARLALCEQEFALAGRPKPGQRRPGPAPEPPPAPVQPFRPRPVRRPPPPAAPAPHPYTTAAPLTDDASPIEQAPID